MTGPGFYIFPILVDTCDKWVSRREVERRNQTLRDVSVFETPFPTEDSARAYFNAFALDETKFCIQEITTK